MKALHLLIIAIFLPTLISLDLAGIRLPIYRLVLLAALFTIVRNRLKTERPSTLPAKFLWGFVFFATLSFLINHSISFAIEPAGALLLESVITFLLPVSVLRSSIDIQRVLRLLIMLGCIQLLITTPETLTGINWLRELLNGSYENLGQRLELYRAFGSFDHPILLGAVVSALFGLAYYTMPMRYVAMTFLSTLTSLSSGAIASLVTQIGLIVWQKLFLRNNRKWALLSILILLAYISIELISNRTFWHAVLTRVTFSAHTAYGRIQIFQWGMDNVYNNPFFGLGLNDWVRPTWKSASIDNMWLVIAIRHGIPAFICYAIAVITIQYKLLKLKTTSITQTAMRRGWLCGSIGICIAAGTVHLWNNAFVFFNLYLGIGAAILNYVNRANHEKA